MARAADVFRQAAMAFQAGDMSRAESLCRKTRKLVPGFHGASYMLGVLLKRRGALPEAASEFVRATRLAPSDFASHHEAGTALTGCGRLPEALGHLKQACELNPASVEARVDLGTALRLAGRPAEAVPHYREALRLRPDHASGHNNLGVALLDLWKTDEALSCFERAIALAPTLAEAHHNLANALKELGRVTEAVTAYRRALELRPDYRDAHSNLLFAMMFDPASDPGALLREAKRFQARFLTLPPAEILAPGPRAAGERPLRIGYLCADFREHVFMLLLPQLLRAHNRDEFEVFCYSNVHAPDAVTELYVERADQFRSIVALDDAAAARVIRNDRIDVLVDLTMHMAHGRLGVFARRPAPLQLTWLAYPGTTGAESIDFRLSDPHLDPPGTDDRYSERTARLPETFWCYDPLSDLPVGELPAKKQGFVTFGSLNTFCKTNERTFALWAQVLRAVSGSRLLLLAPPGSGRQRTCALLEKEGVASDRIEFVDFQPRADYLKTYWRIDIALDTVPYNGHTTSLDAWWMGVPTVTLVGDTVVGRAGLSQAKNLGLDELVAESPDDFVARAAALASDLERLASMRASLRERLERSPLMDGPRFARHFEQIVRGLFRERAHLPPA
jgi:predicted O-linked N-acetylglucosamine transferase (SPINDLY family)